MTSSQAALGALKALGAAGSDLEPVEGASSRVRGKEVALSAAVDLPSGGWSEFAPASKEPAPGWGEEGGSDGGGADAVSGTWGDADPASSADKLLVCMSLIFFYGGVT